MIAPQFEEVLGGFSEGLAAVKAEGRWGYIDPGGRMVVAPYFDEASSFFCGLALVKIGPQRGYIDQAGRFVWGLANW